MFGKTFDKQEVGKPIAARRINWPAEEIARLGNLRVEPPLDMVSGPTGPLIRLVTSALLGRVGKTASGGVPALSGSTPGKATDVVLYSFDGTTLTAGETVTAYNISSVAVGGNKWVLLKRVLGGWWFVDTESC